MRAAAAMAAWLAAVALLGLSIGAALPARADAVRSDRPPGLIVIDDDEGGFLDTYLAWYGRLRTAQVPVRLRGICISACTLVLTLPRSQVCVEPTASFGFHAARVGLQGPAVLEYTNAFIRRYYPAAVQEWLMHKPLTLEVSYMAAGEIVALELFPACDAPAPESDDD